MLGSIGVKARVSPSQISRNGEAKKSENLENIQDKSESKTAKIAESIANGTYKIDLSKTARAIANEII